MSGTELEALVAEIRTLLIETTAKQGGHLAPNLGVVELTLALHKVFNSPQDKIIWDAISHMYIRSLPVGGRISTLRQWGGLAVFQTGREPP